MFSEIRSDANARWVASINAYVTPYNAKNMINITSEFENANPMHVKVKSP